MQAADGPFDTRGRGDRLEVSHPSTHPASVCFVSPVFLCLFASLRCVLPRCEWTAFRLVVIACFAPPLCSVSVAVPAVSIRSHSPFAASGLLGLAGKSVRCHATHPICSTPLIASFSPSHSQLLLINSIATRLHALC
jgi:hypothetical protein